MNKVREEILKTIEEYNLIEKGHHVILGLSGGPDSVCLFDVLDGERKETGFTLSVVHVNHMLRPGAAESDQAYVENLCRERGVECASFVADCHALAVEKAMTDEEAGRALRYESYAKAAADLVAKGISRDKIRIAVAQNADDQVETVLFRLMRGSGTDGLAGMSFSRTDEYGNRIIRPLLTVRKKDIEEYCREKGLNPCIDHTNGETEYTRNRVRHLLIPFMAENFNENIGDAVFRLSLSAAEDRDYFRRAAEEFLKGHVVRDDEYSVVVEGDALRSVHPAMRRRVMAAALARTGLRQDLAFSHYKALDDILDSDSPSARSDLPHGFYMCRMYGDVMFASEEEGKRRKKTDFEPCACDYDKGARAFGDGWENRVLTRERRPGDFIRIKGGGRKKIQDLLVDMKVPKALRDKVRVTACGSEVLAVVTDDKTVRYTACYKPDDSTKKVIYIEINTVI